MWLISVMKVERVKSDTELYQMLSSICASNPGKYVLLGISYCLESYQVNI